MTSCAQCGYRLSGQPTCPICGLAIATVPEAEVSPATGSAERVPDQAPEAGSTDVEEGARPVSTAANDDVTPETDEPNGSTARRQPVETVEPETPEDDVPDAEQTSLSLPRISAYGDHDHPGPAESMAAEAPQDETTGARSSGELARPLAPSEGVTAQSAESTERTSIRRPPEVDEQLDTQDEPGEATVIRPAFAPPTAPPPTAPPPAQAPADESVPAASWAEDAPDTGTVSAPTDEDAVIPSPEPSPIPDPEPVPVPEPGPTPGPPPEPDPEPGPTPGPPPEPVPEPGPTPGPPPEPVPEPEPVSETAPEPSPDPVSAAEIAPETDPVSETTAEATYQPFVQPSGMLVQESRNGRARHWAPPEEAQPEQTYDAEPAYASGYATEEAYATDDAGVWQPGFGYPSDQDYAGEDAQDYDVQQEYVSSLMASEGEDNPSTWVVLLWVGAIFMILLLVLGIWLMTL